MANDCWDRIYDEDSGAHYFQHKSTFETTWDTPAGYVLAETADKVEITPAPESATAVPQEGKTAGNNAGTEKVESTVHSLPDTATDPSAALQEKVDESPNEAPGLGESTNDKWDRIYDEDSAAYYFQHKETFETTWDIPEGYVLLVE